MVFGNYNCRQSGVLIVAHHTALLSVLPQIATEIGYITMIKTDDQLAEYDLRNVIDGVTYSFYLLFVKDKSGLWKIRNL